MSSSGDTASFVPSDGVIPHDEGLLLVAGGESLLTFPLRRDEITIERLRLVPTMTVEDLGLRIARAPLVYKLSIHRIQRPRK